MPFSCLDSCCNDVYLSLPLLYDVTSLRGGLSLHPSPYGGYQLPSTCIFLGFFFVNWSAIFSFGLNSSLCLVSCTHLWSLSCSGLCCSVSKSLVLRFQVCALQFTFEHLWFTLLRLLIDFFCCLLFLMTLELDWFLLLLVGHGISGLGTCIALVCIQTPPILLSIPALTPTESFSLILWACFGELWVGLLHYWDLERSGLSVCFLLVLPELELLLVVFCLFP